jgi:hypothetical protein
MVNGIFRLIPLVALFCAALPADVSLKDFIGLTEVQVEKLRSIRLCARSRGDWRI